MLFPSAILSITYIKYTFCQDNNSIFTNGIVVINKNNTNVTRCRDSRKEKIRKQGRDDHMKQLSI